jgi:two-component system phosphate regulon sensor histidine kinase PhoR
VFGKRACSAPLAFWLDTVQGRCGTCAEALGFAVRISVRTKLFLVSIALIVASMGAADAYLTSNVASLLSDAIRSDLLVRARLVAREASLARTPLEDGPAWDQLARELARAADARVTVIRRDGAVLGDSEVPVAELSRIENQARQPEVQQALDRGDGWGERSSPATQQRTFYVAVPFDRDASVAGVVRVGHPLREVDRATAEMRRLVVLGSLAALIVALMFSSVVARRMTAAVAELTEAVRRMSEGDLSVRTRIEGHDELAELGQALDRLAGSLEATLGQLRAERDLQGRILEAMQEGVVVVDRDGRIALVNPALRSMLLVGADAVGKLLIETVRHAQLEDLLAAAREEPSEANRLEIELPGLKPRRLLVHAAPLSGDDEGLLFVLVDVTELRRLESLRRDFVANASHELRTPIAAVRSATETLRDGALHDPRVAARFVDIIERNAQRLQSLLEDMLELSKLESNEFKLKRERVELGSVVPIVLALFRERAEKKAVRLGAELSPTAGAVEGDARAVEHVLSNLVDNAVKYCPAGTRVLVRASQQGDRVNLVVSDTGPGISAEHLPRVFERFYRVDAGRSRELGGTGLGLSIVKHMVEAMRGKVWVESEVGRGSTFFVSLPRAET